MGVWGGGGGVGGGGGWSGGRVGGVVWGGVMWQVSGSERHVQHIVQCHVARVI